MQQNDVIIRATYQGVVYDLDVNVDTPIRLNISAIENSEIGSTFGVSSQNFELPGTNLNNQFFKHAYMIGADNVPALYQSVSAKVIYNGQSLMAGDMQLSEIIADEYGYVSYKVTVNDQTVGFKEALTGKFIRNCDWSDYEDLDYSMSQVLASWSGSVKGGDLFYPLSNYGTNPNSVTSSITPFNFLSGSYPSTRARINNATTPLKVQQFLPAVKAKVVLDKIFDQAGFSYTGSFFNNPEFDNLYVLTKSQDQLGVSNLQGGDIYGGYAYNAAGGLTLSPGLSSYYGNAPIDTAVNNPAGNFNFSTDQYEVQESGNYAFNYNMRIFWNGTGFFPCFNASLIISIQVKNGPSGFRTLAQTTYTKPPSTCIYGVQEFSLNTGQVFLQPGDDVEVYIQCSTDLFSYPTGNYFGLVWGNITVQQSPIG